MIFASLEDESGVANIIVWSKVFEANRRVVLGARMMAVKGELGANHRRLLQQLLGPLASCAA